MLGVFGNYFLNVSFGNSPIGLDPSQIRELTIVQDLNKFVPELRMRIADSSGAYTHLIPFDQGMSKVQIIVGLDNNGTTTNLVTYLFDVYRRTPTSEAILRGEYDIVGLLAIPNLFSPLYSRGFNQGTSTTIQTVAGNLGISNFNISSSLSDQQTLLQAQWSNAQFLQQLCENLESGDGTNNWRCWISVQNNTQITLNFMGYAELLEAGVKWVFGFGDQPDPTTTVDAVYPVYNYEIVDNYKYLQMLGTAQQDYVYYDYNTSAWVTPTLKLADLESLTPYFSVDSNDPVISQTYTFTGMSNSLTDDFSGKVTSVYESRINNLTKIWITSFGNLNIRPGDLIQLEVPGDAANGLTYQYSGYWLVERIILSFDNTLRMKLLLTRSGIVTTSSTTLIRATNIVQGSLN